MKNLTFVLMGMLAFSNVFSSDHIDGKATQKHKVGDLIDLYAFKNDKNLVLILNTYPLVGKHGHFSSKISYRVLLRKTKIVDFKFETSEEVVINCDFKTPFNHKRHSGSCSLNNGQKAETFFNKVQKKDEKNDFDLFVGMRSDPFFFNGSWASAIGSKGLIPAPEDNNIMAKMNALSIVIEIDPEKLFGDSEEGLIAISSESYTKDETGKVDILDRLGRPEITNVSLNAQGSERDLRDLFNNERSFAIKKENRELYSERLNHNIKYFDKLDKDIHWSKEGREHLVEILVDDFLVIDLSKECEKDSFFSIEKSLLAGSEHTTCGGRLIEDDIMDTLYNTYIHDNKGQLVEDGVSSPYKKPLKDFPYLAPQEKGFSAWSKLQLAKTVLFFKSLF